MRRNKFVELASAFIDGELSPDEEKLLREELRKNPEHRALFAIYKRMNGAVSRARFPVPRPVERRSPVTSTLSWAMSGVLAGVFVSFAFLAMREAPQPSRLRVAETVAAFESPENLAVCSDERVSAQRPSARIRSSVQGLALAGWSFAPAGDKTMKSAVSELPGAGTAPVASLRPADNPVHGDILSRDFSTSLVSFNPVFPR